MLVSFYTNVIHYSNRAIYIQNNASAIQYRLKKATQVIETYLTSLSFKLPLEDFIKFWASKCTKCSVVSLLISSIRSPSKMPCRSAFPPGVTLKSKNKNIRANVSM